MEIIINTEKRGYTESVNCSRIYLFDNFSEFKIKIINDDYIKDCLFLNFSNFSNHYNIIRTSDIFELKDKLTMSQSSMAFIKILIENIEKYKFFFLSGAGMSPDQVIVVVKYIFSISELFSNKKFLIFEDINQYIKMSIYRNETIDIRYLDSKEKIFTLTKKL